MTDNPTLNALLAQDLRPAFVPGILHTLRRAYQEAHHSVTNDSRFGEPEAQYMLGHTRRALVETEFRKIAVGSRLTVEMHKPKRGGCSHVRMLVGRFQLIACHVPIPGAFPNRSDRNKYGTAMAGMQIAPA